MIKVKVIRDENVKIVFLHISSSKMDHFMSNKDHK